MTVTPPNWPDWVGVSKARLWEAVALSLDIEPRPSRNTTQLAMRLPEELQIKFWERLGNSRLHVGYDKLLIPESGLGEVVDNEIILTAEYINLVELIEWPYPAEMQQMKWANVKSSPISALDSTNADLSSENQASNLSQERPLMTRERESLLKIIIATAVDGLGYDPDEKRSPIPQQLADTMQLLEIGLDVDTVRKKLKEAAQFLPSNWKAKRPP